jgi:hypothetical protein
LTFFLPSEAFLLTHLSNLYEAHWAMGIAPVFWSLIIPAHCFVFLTLSYSSEGSPAQAVFWPHYL